MVLQEPPELLAWVRLVQQERLVAWQPQMSKYSWQAELGLNQLVQNPLKFKLSAVVAVVGLDAKARPDRKSVV
jgi:hypothetical protein